MNRSHINPKKQAFAKALLYSFVFASYNFLISLKLFAQDGDAGIQAATDQIRGYFGLGCNLMYAIGAVVGIIGAIKVFNKWNAGEPDTNKVAASWFGSCIFLVIVATVLQSFFGV
ncbi:DUF4134 domain-containing protein [Olivibacter sp. SDN3]|uniref:DUF4134 domain-containing protein n=1 Tax=Olivibacter sp. SDN3 TaxID=2764720 RepID=UPI001650EDFE|nr:DUF4134 domain-containing protein [Olivibacter sp. SDN3]QNL49710.1 DUF4134 domain-containing protein [Olivibacter sp. SDN3]